MEEKSEVCVKKQKKCNFLENLMNNKLRVHVNQRFLTTKIKLIKYF